MLYHCGAPESILKLTVVLQSTSVVRHGGSVSVIISSTVVLFSLTVSFMDPRNKLSTSSVTSTNLVLHLTAKWPILWHLLHSLSFAGQCSITTASTPATFSPLLCFMCACNSCFISPLTFVQLCFHFINIFCCTSLSDLELH